tara:strand:- start:21463 stop:22521 length:1059 start_codon:yes stop_codon:yes gene_type:complete
MNKYTIYNVPILKISESFEYSLLDIIKIRKFKNIIIFVDKFFDKKKLFKNSNLNKKIIHIDTTHEPTTDLIDKLISKLNLKKKIDCIVGVGGGSILDISKAISILLKNKGKCSKYVGWDKVKNPGVYKIAIPTLSGTGAEASKTCVFIDYKKKIKMGINSEYSLFDQVICDFKLQRTVPKEQFFYSAMDTYIHSMESLDGNYRNFIADEKSKIAINLCREVFSSKKLMKDENLKKMMLASFLGGSAIGSSFVGFVHPLSSALSVNYGTNHTLANCIIMKVMKNHYGKCHKEFLSYCDKHKINIPKIHKKNKYNLDSLILSTMHHVKPLENKFGKNFKKKLNKKLFRSIFNKI